MTRFLARVPDDCLVVFDEAYREFVTDPDTPDGLELIARRAGIFRGLDGAEQDDIGPSKAGCNLDKVGRKPRYKLVGPRNAAGP